MQIQKYVWAVAKIIFSYTVTTSENITESFKEGGYFFLTHTVHPCHQNRHRSL